MQARTAVTANAGVQPSLGQIGYIYFNTLFLGNREFFICSEVQVTHLKIGEHIS